MITNRGSLSSQRPATQIQLRRVCTGHLLAAARFANFAGQAELLESAIKAFWNTNVDLMGSAEGRSIITDSLEELVDLKCMQMCPDSSFQVCALLGTDFGPAECNCNMISLRGLVNSTAAVKAAA